MQMMAAMMNTVWNANKTHAFILQVIAVFQLQSGCMMLRLILSATQRIITKTNLIA